MKLTRQFKITCCGKEIASEHDYEAVEQAMRHIRHARPDMVKRLEREGRKAAQSQNGLGYFDSGKKSGDGWHKAQATFREAWRQNALERILGL